MDRELENLGIAAAEGPVGFPEGFHPALASFRRELDGILVDGAMVHASSVKHAFVRLINFMTGGALDAPEPVQAGVADPLHPDLSDAERDGFRERVASGHLGAEGPVEAEVGDPADGPAVSGDPAADRVVEGTQEIHTENQTLGHETSFGVEVPDGAGEQKPVNAEHPSNLDQG